MIKTTEAPQYRRFVLCQKLCQTSAASRSHVQSLALQHAPLGVNDGKGVMFISHTGLFHPSWFMPIVCGLFPCEHIVEIYQKTPIFRGLRDTGWLQGKCGVCEYRRICGGSRARAYAVTGNPFAEEPGCDYVPAAAKKR